MNTLLVTLILIGIIVSHILLRKTLSAYASEKGKNLATKEDISEITELIESTRLSLQKLDRYEIRKYELKYQACLRALSIVDAQLSHLIKNNNNNQPVVTDKQYATTEDIRSCHNELILSLDNSEIISTFMAIMTGSSKNPIIDMNNLRSLIRSELGFPGAIHRDEEKTWFWTSLVKPPQ